MKKLYISLVMMGIMGFTAHTHTNYDGKTFNDLLKENKELCEAYESSWWQFHMSTIYTCFGLKKLSKDQLKAIKTNRDILEKTIADLTTCITTAKQELEKLYPREKRDLDIFDGKQVAQTVIMFPWWIFSSLFEGDKRLKIESAIKNMTEARDLLQTRKAMLDKILTRK